MGKKIIIIGASSGIGRALAKEFSKNGYVVGITGRRTELLLELQKELPGRSFVESMDVARHVQAMDILEKLIEKMGGVDTVVINAGTGHINFELEWDKEKETIDTNVSGFTAMADTAMRYFITKGHGHLAGISSIAALRGSGSGPAYNASKAFISNYMEGLRYHPKVYGKITVTDVMPGFVDTAMAKGEGLFWVAPAEKAAKQIYTAIQNKKDRVYITKRWLFIAWLLRILPGRIIGNM